MKIDIVKKGDYISPYAAKDEESLKQLNDGIYTADLKDSSTRTGQQNSALHKLYDLVAYELNQGGYSVNIVLNRRKYEKIEKVFAWGIEKLKLVPKSDLVLDKMRTALLEKELAEVQWTMQLVKDLIWRPLQIAITEKTSTTKLNKDEIDKVYETFNKLLGERYGVHVPFPSRELWNKKDK